MSTRKSIISILIIGFGFIKAHDFFFSFTWIQFNNAEDLIEIQIKIDKDDLNKVLNKDEKNKSYESLVKKYCYSKVEIFINGKKLDFHFNKIIIEHADVRAYFTAKFIEPETIKIKNTILHEMFKEQVNKVVLRIDNQKKYLELSKTEPQKTIVF